MKVEDYIAVRKGASFISGSLKSVGKNVRASGTGGPGGKQRGKAY